MQEIDWLVVKTHNRCGLCFSCSADSPDVNMLSEDLEGMFMLIRSRTTQIIFQNYHFIAITFFLIQRLITGHKLGTCHYPNVVDVCPKDP